MVAQSSCTTAHCDKLAARTSSLLRNTSSGSRADCIAPRVRVLPEKWKPVFRKEARQKKELEPLPCSTKNGKALGNAESSAQSMTEFMNHSSASPEEGSRVVRLECPGSREIGAGKWCLNHWPRSRLSACPSGGASARCASACAASRERTTP